MMRLLSASLAGVSDFLPIDPAGRHAESDYRCSQPELACTGQDGSAAFERIQPTGTGQYKDHGTCYAAIDFYCLRV
jgi:hypothetical protein